MSYHISREGQTYGPYTFEDLQRYVASGNVLLTDLAKSDDSPDWIPVAQILNPTAGAAAPGDAAVPGVGTPSYVPPAAPYGQVGAYAASPYPDPPNLHWGLVLLIGICTCGIFFVIWDLVQVLWVKRVQPQTKALAYFIAYAVLSVLNVGGSMGTSAAIMQGGHPHSSPLSVLISLASLVFLIVYRFAMRNSLEQHYNGPDPVGLRLGPVMTFFFRWTLLSVSLQPHQRNEAGDALSGILAVTAGKRGRIADLARASAPTASMLLAAALLLLFPPAQYGFYPQCPIHHYFHILCPGCGATRALAALLHGRFAEALHLNALTIMLAPIAVMYAGMHSRRVLSREQMGRPQPPPAAIYATLAVTTIFTIVRNL